MNERKEALQITEKRCSKCGEVKPVSEFYRKKSRKDGYDYYCKECQKNYLKKYQQSEKYKECLKKYKQSEKYKENQKNYLQSEKYKEYQKKYQKKYKQSEKYKENQKKYLKSEKYKECQKKYLKKYKQSEKYAMMLIKTSFGVENIPQEIIDLKKAELEAKREIKKHKSVLD